MKFNPRNFAKVRSKAPWRILFFGTDEFSLGTLKALYENTLFPNEKRVVETLHIVHPWMKKPTPVVKYASMFDMLGHEWPMDERSQKYKYDVGVLASFGHLIPKNIVEAFPYGILNVHPSMLPRWRGAAPLHHTILNGDSKTGVSIMSIKPKHFDVGPILLQKEFEVPPASTTNSLRDLLAAEGGKLIIDVLSNLPEAVIAETPQSTEGVAYAHKITLPFSFIDWANQTADSIDRQYRALHETIDLRTHWEGITVRLLDMIGRKQKPGILLDPTSPPGFPIYDSECDLLWVKCKDGWVPFANIVIKKKMSGRSFYNGYLSKKHLQGFTFKSLENNLFGRHYEEWIRQQRQS